MRDILVPKKNEQELLERANALGYTHVWLLYDKESQTYKKPGTIPYTCMLTSLKKPRNSCIEATIETIRNLAQNVKPAMIYGIEAHSPKDYIHQRGSGINHIIAHFMHENPTAYGFSFVNLLNAQTFERATILGRMTQNIVLFQKYKVRMVIGSFASTPEQLRSPLDLQCLFKILGMQPHELRDAMN